MTIRAFCNKTWVIRLAMNSSAKEHVVLIVEDDASLRETLILILEELDYQAVAAENGQQALARLHEMDTLPCIILLDLMMPVMNGWQFLEAMEKDAALARVPVVVMSAVAETSVESLKVAGHLTKPTTYDQLVAVVQQNC